MLKIVFSLIILAWSHGEDKPGPNGGHIRMPGPFHVELVPLPHGAQVHLLDMNFKNPTTNKSSVTAEYKGPQYSEKSECRVEKKAYLCIFTHKARMNEGELIVSATREGQKGNAAIYKLPLKFH